MSEFFRTSRIEHGDTKTELFKLSQLFVFLFAIIFISINQHPLRLLSTGGVEQWINVLPEFFTGPQDFLFSYGPIYWLTGRVVVQYSQLTYWITALFISIYTAANWAILLRLAMKFKAVIILAVIYAGVTRTYDAAAVFFTLPFFIVLYLRAIGLNHWLKNSVCLLALALLTAFLFYVRFFYGMVAMLTFGSYIFSLGVMKRQFRALIIFSLAAAFFYLIFGLVIFHHVDNIFNYVVINSQLNFGNSVDMTYDIELTNKACLVIALVFVCFNIFLIRNHPELLLTINGLLLIFLKIGFSRADHYIGYFIGPVALLALMCAVTDKRWWLAMAVVILALVFTLGNSSVYPGSRKLPALRTFENFSQSYEDRAAASYPQFKLPDNIVAQIGNQTIDVYPYNNEYMLANKLNYQHRPSFQNYMTLTPVLDNLNAKFFASHEAPEYVLWTGSIRCVNSSCEPYDDFDDKYTLNEDPMTTMAILSYYHVVSTFSDANNKPMMLLKKDAQRVEIKPQTLGDLRLHFGEWVPVPNVSSGVIKLKPQLNFTLLAKMQNMLYRGGILYVNYRLNTGEVKRYRLNIINAQSGIWVSPWLSSFPQKGQRVVEVMLETPNKHYFKDDFSATWQNYPIENIKIFEPVLPTFTADQPAGLMAVTTACDASIDTDEVLQISFGSKHMTRLKSKGWTAFSIARNLAAERAWLTLTDEKGRRFYTPLSATARPDVANHFGKPALTNSGYEILADVTGFKGNYQVGLSIAGEGKLLQCSNFARPITLQ